MIYGWEELLKSSALFIYPNNTRSSFGNNSISYTISNSLGIALNKNIVLQENERNSMDITTGLKSPLLTHVIRPAYAHPYPEAYLDEEVFDPLRNNMDYLLSKVEN